METIRIEVSRVMNGRIYKREIGRGGKLTTDETVRFLGVSPRTIFYMINKGKLNPVKIKGRLHFPLKEIVTLKSKIRRKNATKHSITN